MKSFFDRLQQNIKKDPDRIVLRSVFFERGITYRQLDEASGRVCRYLKDMGIGKEDFVMILMPREVTAYISVIGVWKSGSAMILLEEDYSPERVEYIKSDLNCKLVITKDVYDEMMRCEPVTDYEIPDSHDACYATYTSGSTGKPKGILHEFGKLDTFDYDYNGQLLPVGKDGRFAIVTPLNFGPSIRNAVTSLMYGKCLYIVPRNTVKNPVLLLKYFNDNKINETSVTCSFFRACSFASDYMKNVFVHSEPCSGIHAEGINVINVINLYTLSEVVFPVYTFSIDMAYNSAPLGYANRNAEIVILNEKGERAKPREIGEITVRDLFTRGYINLPEKTAEAFKNGYFHSGDFGYYDEKGMVYLCGRKDDMIKINGNRIEPLEIEANIKNLLSVENAVAKGFNGDDRSFIAVYLLKKELCDKGLGDKNGNLIFSVGEMRDKLKSMLPDYMLPTYYVTVDSYPYNENGKLSRKDLPKPFISEYLKNYEPPQNDGEEYFCHLFERVLELDRVGVNDDFYQIGGDSLSAMKVVGECDKFELSVFDIYNARTPRSLSLNVTKDFGSENLQKQNENALCSPQPLSAEQRAVYEVQLRFPDYILDNLTRFYKLKKGTDTEKLKNAVDKVFRHHPVFSSVPVNENGTVKLSYKPQMFNETAVKTVTERELKAITEKEPKPFAMENELLYRHAIYKCNGEIYFFLEIHHLITDGISLKMLFDEIGRCYGDNETELPPDYYFLFLERNSQKESNTPVTPEKIRELYGVSEFMRQEDNSVNADGIPASHIPSEYERVLDIKKDRVLSSEGFGKYGGNVFFLTCFLKTLSVYNGNSKAFSFWVYGGREQSILKNVHGSLIKTMPMGIDFSKDAATVKKGFEFVKKASEKQIACDVDFIDGITDDFMFSPYFIYQRDVLTSDKSTVFEENIELRGGCMPFEFHLIDNTREDCFKCKVKYTAEGYKSESVEKFCRLFEKTVIESII